MFDAVVLAGTSKETELTKNEQVSNKAFIKVGGCPLLAFTLAALRAVPAIDRIAVVGPAKDLEPLIEPYRLLVVPEEGGIPENILAGYRALRPPEYFLVVSADIPLLSARAVEDFLERARPYEYDFYYPVVRREDIEARFPGVKRTYARLREGTFTGGNLFLLNPDKVETAMPRLGSFIKMRKSPAKLAALLGIGFIIKFLTRRLSIAELEKRLPGLLGVSGKAIITGYAEIGTDVDKPADLELVKRELKIFSQ